MQVTHIYVLQTQTASAIKFGIGYPGERRIQHSKLHNIPDLSYVASIKRERSVAVSIEKAIKKHLGRESIQMAGHRKKSFEWFRINNFRAIQVAAWICTEQAIGEELISPEIICRDLKPRFIRKYVPPDLIAALDSAGARAAGIRRRR